MIVLTINKPVKYKPVKWAGKDLSEMKPGQSFVRFVGNHPNNPELGSIEIDVKIVEGSFDGIGDILLIEDEPQKAKLIKWEKKLLGGYRITIEFDAIFGHGLEYSTQELIKKGGGIIGFSESDKVSLKNLEGQKKLLQLLLQLMLPKKRNQIENLAIPCLLLKPNDHNDPNSSHFVGTPKIEAGTAVPETSDHIPLMHLATLNLEEFQELIDYPDLKKYLTFFINVKNTENGWPEPQDKFRVFNTNTVSNITEVKEISDSEKENNFDVQLYLDIPKYDHCILKTLNLSEEEEYEYEALEACYKSILSSDFEGKEMNKFLGYPDSVQGCVAYEAERLSSNRGYSDEIYKDAVNWKLLLQVSPYCKWFKFFDEFGDGSIYFMIRKDDLMNGNFENTQVVVQNT